ncbi:M48 family metallopeptidase [Neptunicoccus cionae]|uniref:M48 family metallopeptidase n=1 Tax=Neptunicoccus cionae TaxID=2035344 RepID=UPI000C764536|nr:SprT family zinc-dependent metalloprotease [Amylibacter cionae]PLS22074.1 M48 family peptidase [Amylibacter cionae]
MPESFEIGAPPIAVVLKKSARARRFSLRISNVDGTVSLTMPKRAAKRDALAFAAAQEGWMRKHLDKQPDRITPVFGGTILIDGVPVVLLHGQGRRVEFTKEGLVVPGSQEQLAGKLRAYLKALARDRLTHASERYAAQVGRKISRITLRDTRSRWGSCTSDGNLMYSWRLIMAPRAVQDYVAAHEVCHLLEMNHSAAYWAHVAAIFPDYQAQRQWLRDNGAQLHRVVL